MKEEDCDMTEEELDEFLDSDHSFYVEPSMAVPLSRLVAENAHLIPKEAFRLWFIMFYRRITPIKDLLEIANLKKEEFGEQIRILESYNLVSTDPDTKIITVNDGLHLKLPL